MADDESRLDVFIGKFAEPNQALIRSVRAALRRRLPTATELVYDNYNFFVIGYCSSERPSDCIVSLAASAKGVSLSFYRGADLVDAHGVLLGAGSQNRFVRLSSAATLLEPAVDDLIEQAARIGKVQLPVSGSGKLVIRSVSAKQRPRQ